ncbi:hypothetical protein CsSME_00041289 [Camellia sinensis var. sinensis]
MGDLQVFSQQPNGVLTEDRSFSVSFSPPLPASNPDPSSIGEESWAIAEQTTQQVICCIHPTLDSEEKRKDVIEYVQRLIRCSLGFEVNSMPHFLFCLVNLLLGSSSVGSVLWVNSFF